MSYFSSARGIGKAIYPIRAIGYTFGAATLFVYRYQLEAVNGFAVLTLGIFLIYPHAAFYYYQFKDCQSRLEIRNLIFDGFLVGLFSAQMHFALLPMVSYFAVVAATSMGVKGPKLFGSFVIAFLFGSAAGGLMTGFLYDANPSLAIQTLSISYLLIGTVSHNFIDFQRSLKFMEAKEQIKHQKIQIEENLHEKELLLKEVHHRVKNNLQIITSLLNLQAEHIQDESALNAIKSSKGRVKSMSTVHEILYQNDNIRDIDISDYIPRLAGHVKRLYDDTCQNIKLVCEVEPIAIGLKTAIPLGLILNEVISNSCKHAFPDRDSGKISIKAALKDGNILLSIADNGTGLNQRTIPKNRKDGSLGMQLVEDMTKQLNASGRLENKNGTVHHLTIPFLPS